MLEVGPATASLWLSSALRRYRRARSLAFQALLIREASSAPQARFWTWGWSHTGLRKGIETKLKVSKGVWAKPHLHQKAELEVGPAAASPWLSSAWCRYRRAKSLTFQALQIGATSLAPQVPSFGRGAWPPLDCQKSIEKVDENTFWMYNECVDRIWMTMFLRREG